MISFGRPTPTLLLRASPIRLRLHSTSPHKLVRISRHASTTQDPTVAGETFGTRTRNFLYSVTFALGIGAAYLYATDTRSATLHQYLVPALLRLLVDDAEDAHEVGTRSLRILHELGIGPRERASSGSTSALQVNVWETLLDNPVGISAGLDKKAEIPSALFDIGAGIVEVGGITPRPQGGNPRPRVWRIPSENALINRYGLQSEGADRVAERLRGRIRLFTRTQGLGVGPDAEQYVLDGRAGVPKSLVPGKLLAVQISKNKDTPSDDLDAVRADYIYCCTKLARYADIITVNVSSPNTPGLRAFQKEEPLQYILNGVRQAAQSANPAVKVMVKCSPDEDSAEDIRGICNAVASASIDGIIIGNTTRKRPDALPGHVRSDKETNTLREEGGYSGGGTFERTLELVKKYKREIESNDQLRSSNKELVIFATGGISNGQQALKVLQAGADVAMVYTAMVYGGIGTVTRIKDEMRRGIEAPKQ